MKNRASIGLARSWESADKRQIRLQSDYAKDGKVKMKSKLAFESNRASMTLTRVAMLASQSM